MNLWQYLMWMLSGNTVKSGPTVKAGTYALPAALVEGAVFDDFNGPAGTPPDPTLWTPVAGVARGPSTSDVTNATLDGNGNLQLTADLNADGSWSSALVHSVQTMEYGTFAARIKIPAGAGIHATFWSMGQGYNFADYASGTSWPTCGETDMFEWIGDNKYYSTVHGPRYKMGSSDTSYNQSQLSGSLGFDPTADFHVYWCQKTTERVTFGIDGTTTGAIGELSIPKGAPWELSQPQQVIFSVTVNGPSDWGGGTDSTTPVSTSMLVDWFSWAPAS